MLLRPRAPKTAIAASALLLLAGCSLFEPSDVPEKKQGENVEIGLFDEGYVPRFELSVKEEDWAWLNTSENALKEEYVPAALKIDGVEIDTVGVRYKGANSLAQCFKAGAAPCPRASLKIAFDLYNANARVDGLRRINLHWPLNDDSMLRERLTYRLFREMGVETSRAANAVLSVNGGPFGLYAMVEQIDEAFLEDRWGSAAGADNLWKEIWPREVHGDWTGKIKHGTLLGQAGVEEFARALREAAGTGNRKLFERHVDPAQALDYLAVDVVSDNIDGYRTFYCQGAAASPEDCEPHNFYWRQTWPGNRFTLIPWDHNSTFLMDRWLSPPEWNDTTVSCDTLLPIDGHRLWHAGCDPWFKALRALYPDEWKAAMKRLMNGPMKPYVVERWLKEWKNEIEPFVDEDTLFHSVHDKTWWEKGYSGLTSAVGRQRQLMQDRLDGRLP